MANKETRFEDILNECLEGVRSGRATIEQCLAQYPERASELEGLLRMAAVVGSASAVRPSAEFKARARYRFQEAIAAKSAKRPARGHIWRHGWAIGLAAVVAVGILGGGTVAASASSLPDQPLYPVKLAREQVQVFFARTPVERAKLNASLAGERVQEMEAMAAEGKVAQVNGLAARLDAELAQIEKPTGLSQSEAAVLRRHLEAQSVKQIDKLQAIEQKAPAQAKAAVDKAIQAVESGYEKALQKAGAQPEQMEKIRGRWQSGAKQTPPGRTDAPTPTSLGQMAGPPQPPTSTPLSNVNGSAPTPAPTGRAGGPPQTPPGQINRPPQTPPGQMNRATPTPAGQTPGPTPIAPGQTNGSTPTPTPTPTGRIGGPPQTPPGQMNKPTPTPSGQAGVPTPTAPGQMNGPTPTPSPTPAGRTGGPPQTPPGQMKK